jgi:hypothetical protein
MAFQVGVGVCWEEVGVFPMIEEPNGAVSPGLRQSGLRDQTT